MARPVLYSSHEVDYPSADGLPIAESDFQREPLIYAVEALRIYFQARQDVYVSGNLFLYYEEGNPQAVVAPDVFVVLGAAKHDRPSYRLWQEPKAPDFVLEITSRSTRSADQGTKRGLYAYLGVREYWQYDPTGDYLVPVLHGLVLLGDHYAALPATTLADGTLSLPSAVLGLDVRLEQGQLRFVDPATGAVLLTHQEAEQARQQVEQARQHAEARVRQERTARQVAEARLAELQARLQALEAERSAPPSPSDDVQP
jgi:Uma2 family endonuclease